MNWIDAHDHYLTDVPGCSYHMAANAFRAAAQDFCKLTRAWRVALDPIITRKNVTEYELDLSTEQEVFRVLSAKVDGRDVPVLLHAPGLGAANGLYVVDPYNIVIRPVPAAGQRIEIIAALQPSNSASTLDDRIARQHIRVIAEGAKAELFGKKNQPFTDAAASSDARAKFQSGVDKVLADVAASYSSGPQRVRASFM